MFVNIIRGGHSRTIECRDVAHYLHPDKKETILMEVERLDGHIYTYEFTHADKEACGVYLMNEAGKTIDTIFKKNES